jgi:hypothetical protein
MKKILSLLIVSLVVMSLGVVSAVHDSSVEVDPSGWLAPNAAEDFTFTVTNEGSSSVKEVIIDIPTDFSNLVCGAAPTDWTTVIANADTCSYRTTSDVIDSGNSEIFTLTTDTSLSSGDKTWLVVTKDIGDFDYLNNPVSIVKTIQSTIDDWTFGDGAIEIPEGVYEEDLWIEGKNGLELKPEVGAEVTIRGESLVLDALGYYAEEPNIMILSDDVKIHGFRLESPISISGSHAVMITLGASDIEIYNNDFEIAVGEDGNAPSVAIVTYCDDNFCAPGPYNNNVDISGLDIHDNSFSSLAGTGSYEAVYINPDIGTSTIYIEDNEFSGEIHRAVAVERSDVVISSNDMITDFESSWQGLSLVNWYNNDIEDVEISENEIEGFSLGIRLAHSGEAWSPTGLLSEIAIIENIIQNSDTAIQVYRSADEVIVNDNIIIENALGVDNEDVETLDATNNEWGVATYLEILDLVDGNVNFDPWLPLDTIAPVIEFTSAPYFSETLMVTISALITEGRALDKYVIEFGDGEILEVNISEDYDTEEIISEDHTYSTNGDYFVSITAYDKTGNYATETTAVSIDDNEYDWRIPLTTGWNLISFPMIPLNDSGSIDTSIENVILNRIYDSLPGGYDDVVMQYDAINKNWKESRRTGSGNLDHIIPGYAYWVEVTQDTVLKGFGRNTEPAPSGLPPSIELGSGWNLIGKFGDADVQKDASRDNLIFDDGFRNLGDFPLMYDGDFLEDTDSLERYEGYWTLLSGNNDNSITYTVFSGDYL